MGIPAATRLDIEAYRDILLPRDDERQLSVRANIPASGRTVRRAFAEAARSSDPLTPEFIERISGVRVFHRSTLPEPNETHDFRYLTRPIAATLLRQFHGYSVINTEAAVLKGNIHLLREATGLPSAIFQSRLNLFKSATIKNSESALNKSFCEVMGVSESELSVEIAEGVRKSLRGELAPLEKEQLEIRINQFVTQGGISKESFDFRISHYTVITNTEDDLLSSSLNDALVETIHSPGFSFVRNQKMGMADAIIVPSISEEKNFVLEFFFSDGDRPSRLPPGSNELWQFLVALHEAEHATQSKTLYARTDATQFEKRQACEIDADAAVLRTLRSMNEPEIRDYWLQLRHIRSFSDGVHDTATFLRVLEETGRQIDMRRFNAEKQQLRDLLDRILGKAETKKIGDIMGVLEDALEEDSSILPEGTALSSLQRDQAQTFIEDALALGFTSNPNYKMAPQTPENREVARAPAIASGTPI